MEKGVCESLSIQVESKNLDIWRKEILSWILKDFLTKKGMKSIPG